MRQGHKLENGNFKFDSGLLVKNLKGGGKQKAALNLFQTYLFKEYKLRNRFLTGLPFEDLRELLTLMDHVYLEKNRYIYKPDDEIQYLYFPETAVVSEFQLLEDGKAVEVSMTGREGFVGVSTVFNEHHSENWSQVLIPGKSLRLEAALFRQKLASCPAFKEMIFEFINSYIGQISQRVICNKFHSARERLCYWLLMINDSCGSEKLPLTQEQTAHFLGVQRPSITIITQTLRDENIIDYVRGRITILDRAELEKSACICYKHQ